MRRGRGGRVERRAWRAEAGSGGGRVGSSEKRAKSRGLAGPAEGRLLGRLGVVDWLARCALKLRCKQFILNNSSRTRRDSNGRAT